MASWVRVADEADLKTVMRVEASGRELAVFRLPDGIFALDDVCSHEYARLSEGEVWGEKIWCPRHGSNFNIKTGAVSGLPATRGVESFPVKVEDGGIHVLLEEAW